MSDSTEAIAEGQKENESQPKEKLRNVIAYWFLGLCNNFAYVIMLSAATDILGDEFIDKDNSTTDPQTPPASNTTDRDCNVLSAGAVLLADVVPSLLITMSAPFLLSFIRLRVVITVLVNCCSFLLVSLCDAQWQAILGVVCASVSCGLGEVTLLQYSARYHKNIIASWSSGTGGAGLFASLLYATLTAVLKPRSVVLIMLFVPFLMAFSFFVVLEHKKEPTFVDDQNGDETPAAQLDTRGKLNALPRAFGYMLPLGLTYFFQYFLNQGVSELIIFDDIWLDAASQYRWIQVTYQLGVFVSRSTANLIRINNIWLLTFFQVCCPKFGMLLFSRLCSSSSRAMHSSVIETI